MQILANGLLAGSIYALVAVGFAIIYSTGKFFHFAHGAVYSVAAYVAYYFVVYLHFAVVAAIGLAMIFACVLGALVQTVVYRPLSRRGGTSLALLLASLGVATLLQNIIPLVFGDAPKSFGSVATEGISLWSARLTCLQVITMATSMVVCATVAIAWHRTSIGRIAQAVADDRELSIIMGVNVDRVLVIAIGIGSALAGLAAVLAALDTGITPSVGMSVLLIAVVGVVIGGVGSVLGAVLGAMLVGLVQSTSAWVLPTQWQDAAVFLTLIFFLVARPQGIIGTDRARKR